jgi:hypothetical protein
VGSGAVIDIDIPLHPALAESIAATTVGNMTFLITEYGKPFTANGFGNKFKDWCRQADLRIARLTVCAKQHQQRWRKLAQRRTRSWR